jgi:DNA-binding response OmpR family regulator
MNNVLIVDDDPGYRYFFSRLMDRFGHRNKRAETAKEGLILAQTNFFQTVVVDWRLPGMSGLSFLQRLRLEPDYTKAPIVMISGAMIQEDNETRALECGATAFFTKYEISRDPETFQRHFNAILRAQPAPITRYQLKDLCFLIEEQKLIIGQTEIALNRKELELFRIFVHRPRILHTHEYLWSAVWEDMTDGWRHTLESRISTLRSKLGKNWGSRLICRKGLGFQFLPNL